jgi:CheY-like chemotaxis protein
LNKETFAAWVHEGLAHLYDAAYLQTHPLGNCFGFAPATAHERGQLLRQILLEAIEVLRPARAVSAQSAPWRAYRILELRYLEERKPAEIMRLLSMGRSLFFSEQARITEAVVQLLWDRVQAAPPVIASDEIASAPTPHDELDRLYAQASWEPLDVTQTLLALRPVLEPLAQAKQRRLSFALRHQLLIARADRVLLRLSLFQAVTWLLNRSHSGLLQITSFVDAHVLGVALRVSSPVQASDDEADLLALHRFMGASNGMLAIERREDELRLRLIWPVAQAETRLLLVIDDYPDMVDLFRRYLAGSPWQVVGATSGAEARDKIAQQRPTLIALDVMLPHEDGWELLLALKADEQTSSIPIVICSVLREPEMAPALGAAGYLIKPLTRAALLEILAPWNEAPPSPAPITQATSLSAAPPHRIAPQLTE